MPTSHTLTPSTPPRRRILFLDAHDSFSNNITSLLHTLLDADVFVLPIDAPLVDAGALRDELARYDAVVCGPGPGSPDRDADVGLMRHVWEEAAMPIPALGICLGFQSLAVSCGAQIRRLRRGLHGMVRTIAHRAGEEEEEEEEGNVFAGVGVFRATLYHSLGVDVGQDTFCGTQAEWEARARWRRPEPCPDVVPLAWVDEPRGGADDDVGDGDGDGFGAGGVERILMAMRHRTRPFWGVQYHPESVCTEAEGNKVVVNWFREALRWNKLRGRVVVRHAGAGALRARNATRPSLLSRVQMDCAADAGRAEWWQAEATEAQYHAVTLPLPQHIQVPDIVEALDLDGRERIVLDSANAVSASARADVRGRYSIIALHLDHAIHLKHVVAKAVADLSVPGRQLSARIPLEPYGGIWGFLAHFHGRRRQKVPDPAAHPFLGGFMGYISYEQGLDDIGIRLPQDRGHQRPDVFLIWVTHSIVVDHVKGTVCVQELRPGKAASRVDGTVNRLVGSDIWQYDLCDDVLAACAQEKKRPRCSRESSPVVRTPDKADYEQKVRACQEHIAAGDSYELCLTDQTWLAQPLGNAAGPVDPAPDPAPVRSGTHGPPSSWTLFKALRARQPAPFASYLRLGGVTLVSASPERFLQHDRAGLCSMRPMKGTVRKGTGGVATLAAAEALLHVPKEEAENLMIVDLVRHDLHGVCGPGRVAVPRLLVVEEYASVFQMVTLVEGRLPAWQDAQEGQQGARGYTGLDVLAASLPPGSMTGAPKRRSCELLLRVERGRERGLYSGVVGYMCASGAGDWSVTIRSLFRWDDEVHVGADGEAREVWHIGAGGAVTILSTPEGERDEMFAKLGGPLGVFLHPDS